MNLLSRTVRNDTQETRTWTSVTVSRTAPPILLQKSHGVKRLHMNIHIIIYTHTVPQPPGGTAEFTFSYKSSSVPNWNVGFSVSPMAGLFLLCGCVCVCVCVLRKNEDWRHLTLYITVWANTFGVLVTCVCECVVCVSPFCCTTVGVLPSVSSWESDLWVCEVWVCEVWVCEVCICVRCVLLHVTWINIS